MAAGSVAVCRMTISSPRCSRCSSASADATGAARLGIVVMVRLPLIRPSCSASSASAASEMAIRVRARRASSRPASVRVALRAVRSSSTAPVSRSRVVSCWEIADGE